jgi:hypothetical protein
MSNVADRRTELTTGRYLVVKCHVLFHPPLSVREAYGVCEYPGPTFRRPEFAHQSPVLTGCSTALNATRGFT